MKARIVSVIAFLALALGLTPLVTAPAQASVADPNATVLPNGKWFSGNLLSMWGLNCSTAILGSAYNEIMIQGYASYGATNGAPKVNETYYAMVTLSEPGFPCGTGISIPELRLRLPANTQLAIDAQHPIRCFVTPRFQSVWDETTNAGNWTIDAIKGQDGKPLTGPWCRPTPYQVDQFTWSIGSPAMANGTMHKVFVPLRSTSTLSNVALQWEVRDPVTYEGMQLSEARLWVFPQSLNQASPVFFFPDKAVIPFWDAAAPAGAQNRAEFFANLYTGGQAGYLCYEVRRKSDNGLVWECANGLGFDGTVAAGQGIVQLLPTGVAKGPNGGYAPFAFDPPEYDKDYTVQWFFRTSPGGSIITSSPKIDFRSLAGPDGDQDGVIDAADKCPGTKGTAADGGCPPALPADTDGDGVVGAADQCPTVNGGGALNGCPVVAGGGSPTTTPIPQPAVTSPKTLALPAKLRGAKRLKSTTPKVCKISGKGKKAKVVQFKAGKCKLVGTKKGKRVKVTLRLR